MSYGVGKGQKALIGSCACNVHDWSESSAPLARDARVPSTVHRDDDENEDDALMNNALNDHIILNDDSDTQIDPKASNNPFDPIDVPPEPNVTNASTLDVTLESTRDERKF